MSNNLSVPQTNKLQSDHTVDTLQSIKIIPVTTLFFCHLTVCCLWPHPPAYAVPSAWNPHPSVESSILRLSQPSHAHQLGRPRFSQLPRSLCTPPSWVRLYTDMTIDEHLFPHPGLSWRVVTLPCWAPCGHLSVAPHRRRHLETCRKNKWSKLGRKHSTHSCICNMIPILLL